MCIVHVSEYYTTQICINIYLPTADENIWRAANTRNVPLLPSLQRYILLFSENPTLSKTLELKRAKLLQMCETLLHFAATYSGLPEDIAGGNSEVTQDFLREGNSEG